MIDYLAAHPRVTLMLIGLAWATWYLLACWLWPFSACWWCEGGRKYQSKRRKAWRPCRRCRGTGQRRRIGRVVWAYFAGSKKQAKRRGP